jgi:endonuclease/exonuclease/phosphatase family metal-dependent hydrolase
MKDNIIKLATWNLLWTDYDYMARLEEASLHLTTADIICLQEVREDDKFHVGVELSKLLNLNISANVPFIDNLSHPAETSEVKTYLVILSKYKTLESGYLDTKLGDYGTIAYTVLDTDHRPTLVITAHLQWRGDREYDRLTQAEAINDFAVKKELEIIEKYNSTPIVVLAGDFNTEPKSQTIAYLTGKYARDNKSQTYWVDSWDFLRKEDSGFTTSPKFNHLAKDIASRHVYDPDLVPSRRIDYIMVKGWAYGNPGHPLGIELLGDVPRGGKPLPSDHYGLIATLWNPPPQDV